MTDEEWIKKIKVEEAAPAAATQPPVINNYYFVDNSINIQAIVSDGQTSARIVDNRSRLADDIRRYLPPNYQPTNSMEEAAQKLLAPMTKEEKAGLGPWQCF